MRGRRGAWLALVSSALVLSLPSPDRAAQMETITQKSQTAHYRLVLQIGPEEKMYSKAEAAKLHPTSGEVMASGTMGGMSMGGDQAGMAMDTRHLEVHVFSRTTGHVITDAKCSITVTSTAAQKSMAMPVAAMYGVVEGPADWHYGNNVSMPPGAYTIAVVVNGEHATFHVTIPKM